MKSSCTTAVRRRLSRMRSRREPAAAAAPVSVSAATCASGARRCLRRRLLPGLRGRAGLGCSRRLRSFLPGRHRTLGRRRLFLRRLSRSVDGLVGDGGGLGGRRGRRRRLLGCRRGSRRVRRFRCSGNARLGLRRSGRRRGFGRPGRAALLLGRLACRGGHLGLGRGGGGRRLARARLGHLDDRSQRQLGGIVAVAGGDGDAVVAGLFGRMISDRGGAVALDRAGIGAPLEIIQREIVLFVFDADREGLVGWDGQRGRGETDQARRPGLLAAAREKPGDDEATQQRVQAMEVQPGHFRCLPGIDHAALATWRDADWVIVWC